MWPRCETCCQRSGLVPISGTMDGTRGASGWGKLTVDFVDQNPGIAGRKPMTNGLCLQFSNICCMELIFCNRWWITQCCLFVFGGTPGFRCAEGLLPSTSSDIWSLGCLMVSWPQSWLRWAAASRCRLVSLLKRFRDRFTVDDWDLLTFDRQVMVDGGRWQIQWMNFLTPLGVLRSQWFWVFRILFGSATRRKC